MHHYSKICDIHYKNNNQIVELSNSNTYRTINLKKKVLFFKKHFDKNHEIPKDDFQSIPDVRIKKCPPRLNRDP